jgi:hypothetical protein
VGDALGTRVNRQATNRNKISTYTTHTYKLGTSTKKGKREKAKPSKENATTHLTGMPT